MITNTVYYTPSKPQWDLQSAIFTYLELNDKLTGSDYKRQVLQAFDDNGDGVIDYLETGQSSPIPVMAYERSLLNQKIEPAAAMKFRFLISALQIKLSRKEWKRKQALSKIVDQVKASEELIEKVPRAIKTSEEAFNNL